MRNVAKQGKIVNLIAFLLGEVGRGPDRDRMRGRFTVAARKRVIAARLALISQRTGPLTASPAGEAFLFFIFPSNQTRLHRVRCRSVHRQG